MKRFLLFFCLFSLSVISQNKFDVSGELRARFEIDNRDFSKDISSKTFTAMRSRLNAKFTKDQNIEAFIQLQDSRNWGQEGSPKNDIKNIDLHQAFILVKDFFGMPLDFQAGRMEINYANQRLISQSNWGNIGHSFDGFIVKIKTEPVTFDFFALQLNENGLTSDLKDGFLSGIYTSVSTFKNYKIDPFVFWERDLALFINRVIPGIYINGKFGHFKHETELIYQAGSFNNQDISAYLLGFNLDYVFPGDSKTTLSAGIEYLSGDDNMGDKEYKVFNTLYGSGHTYFGGMDIFTNIPAHTKNLGLNDMHIKASTNLTKTFNVKAAFHIFNSTVDAKLTTGSVSKSFGNEIDLILDYKYSPEFSIQGGISLFSPGDIFKDPAIFNRKDMSTWTYLMTTIKL